MKLLHNHCYCVLVLACSWLLSSVLFVDAFLHKSVQLPSINVNTSANQKRVSPSLSSHSDKPQDESKRREYNDEDNGLSQAKSQGKHNPVSVTSSTSRRHILHNMVVSALTLTAPPMSLFMPVFLSNPQQSIAATTENMVTKKEGGNGGTTALLSPPITHKVNFNVRISRADGTFYVRDDPPEIIQTPDNQVFTGTICIGLYGTFAPNHVQKFLQYVETSNDNTSNSSNSGSLYDNVYNDPFEPFPYPSYSKSVFSTFDQSTGLLIGGSIPGLFVNSLNGASALDYRGRITPASLWIDDFSQSSKISHSRKGLVTHRNFEVLPTFGITTRQDRELDSTHTVFGEVISTDSSIAFFNRIVDLPTYSNTRIGGGVGTTKDDQAVDEIKSSLYSFQKDFFRSAAKSFGDTRLDNIYEGKILRRVEVTSVSVEKLLNS